MKNFKYFLLLLFFLPSLAFGAVKEPVAYYALDNNSNDSIGTLHGTNYSISYNSTFGILNEGIKFDSATAKIDLPTSSAFNSAGLSVSFWIKAYGTLPTTRHTQFITKGAFPSGYNSDWMIARAYSSGEMFFALSRDSDNIQKSVSFGSTMFDGDWHNVICNWDSGVEMECYVDTVSIASLTTDIPTYLDNSYNIAIGDHSNGCSVCDSPYDWAYMDEIAIFDEPLTQTEINTIYNEGTPIGYPFEIVATTSSTTVDLYPCEVPENTVIQRITGCENIYDNSTSTPVAVRFYSYDLPIILFLYIAIIALSTIGIVYIYIIMKKKK